MEGSPIIAGILFACLALVLWGADSLLNRRLGKRDIGVGGMIATVPIMLSLIWLASHFVSNESYYWFVAIGACGGISSLIVKSLLGTPRQTAGK